MTPTPDAAAIVIEYMFRQYFDFLSVDEIFEIRAQTAPIPVYRVYIRFRDFVPMHMRYLCLLLQLAVLFSLLRVHFRLDLCQVVYDFGVKNNKS